MGLFPYISCSSSITFLKYMLQVLNLLQSRRPYNKSIYQIFIELNDMSLWIIQTLILIIVNRNFRLRLNDMPLWIITMEFNRTKWYAKIQLNVMQLWIIKNLQQINNLHC